METIVTGRWKMKIKYKMMWIPDSKRDDYSKEWHVDTRFEPRTTTKHETVIAEEPLRLYWQMEREPLKPLQMRVRRGRLYD